MTAKITARPALRLGGALAALAAPATAGAQAFTANPTTIHGSVTYDRATAGVETITVNSPSAVINWNFVSPIGNPIVFQPTGTTATFRNGPNNGDFAVLNRIVPGGAAISMDGTVISQILTSGGQLVPGGTVIFSSPTGIVVGPNAVFDVGRLMLTSLDPILDANGEFLVGGNILLADGSNFPNAAIVTQAGSRIDAPADGSWVVLAAPQVTHGGSVRVNGSAAYVGAEIVSITINEGLFDINIFTGSTQTNLIVHTGTTGGPASTGAPDNHMIAMVASPRAAPMTMLLSGSVGFDAAVSASVENGAIVLSAGHDTFGTQINPVPDSEIAASARITGGIFTSDVTGRARSDFLVGNTGAGTLTFTQDVAIAGYDRAHLTADQGFAITVGGDATVSAANLRPVRFGAAVDVTGGEALLRAGSGSTIAIAGSATVDASARGGVDDQAIAGAGTGGQALVAADKGSIEVAGSLNVVSNGSGALDPQFPPPDRGGDGSGGTALASALNGGTLQVGGALQLDASGTGTAGTGATPGIGATGTGGTARVEALSAGSVLIEGPTAATASGTGGEMGSGAGNVGGIGQGGTAAVLAAGGAIDLNGPASLAADGSGGRAPQGGTGTGGFAFVEALEGRATLAAAAQLRANGSGGDAALDSGGRGGDGTGGRALLLARQGAAEGALTAPSATLAASGTGGVGAPGAGAAPGGAGGDGRGGDVRAIAEAGNGRLQVGALTAQSLGTGGAGGAGLSQPGGAGGAGLGGEVLAAMVATGAGGSGGRAEFASAALTSSGQGGAGGAGTPAGAGGPGTGGRTTLSSTDAPLAVSGTATLAATGIGGAGATIGTATGGDVVARSGPLQAGSGGSLTVARLDGTSLATGSPPAVSGLGRWIVTADRGAIRIGAANLRASATGTPAAPTASEVQLLGGTVDVAGQGNFLTDGLIRLSATESGRLSGGNILFDARAGIVLTHSGRAAGAFTVDAQSFTALTPVDYSAALGTAVRGASVDIRAGRDATLALTDGTATLDVTAGRLARFLAAATGRQITATSADIDVPAGGSIGNAGTNLVSLVVQPNANATTLGGGAQGPGYTLTEAEAGRLQSAVVRVSAPAGAAGPAGSSRIVVGNLNLNATAAQAFEIASPGIVRVDGALLLANAGAANRIGIAADTRLEVATPGGGIRVRDAQGNPAGSLTVAAGDIWATSPATLGLLAADPNFAGRDQALETNDGADAPRGWIEAGAITLAPRATLFVENSGTPAAFGGLTVGAGQLTIRPSGNGPASVFAFGRRLNPDGSSTVNIPFFFQVDYSFGNSAGYTNDSEFNRCLINTPRCGAPFGGIPGGSRDFVLRAFPIPPQEPPGETVDEDAFAAEPLIEEPVTSGSDSTLWIGPDRDDDDDDDDEDEEEE